MNKDQGTKNHIIWNIVSLLSMIAIITLCALSLKDINNSFSSEDGGLKFLYALGILTASIVLIWNLYRIYIKIPKAEQNKENNKK